MVAIPVTTPRASYPSGMEEHLGAITLLESVLQFELASTQLKCLPVDLRPLGFPTRNPDSVRSVGHMPINRLRLLSGKGISLKDHSTAIWDNHAV